ncbi:3-methyl-2-oxobutanoate dehydrogenase subunit beta [bacterium]|nr:MAG: 3-methyl-2-oxobutanoate dehydrogenase subunit beta [bacterium]
MPKELIKGNEAVIKGALLAGCDAFFGYPITPASEIAHAAAKYFPLMGKVFLQAESEIASIQMCYGAAGAGLRTMTASSGPGLSLKMEGISYACGSELPIVIVDVVRGGPGLGNIAPSQSDYNQIVKGGGHGNYKLMVLAPNSAQEMCDLTMLAFELADKYRNPVVILTDGFNGQMMEPVDFPEPKSVDIDKTDWAVMGTPQTRRNLINSIYLDPVELEQHNQKLQEKYKRMQENEVRVESYKVEDAEVVGIAYGTLSRVMSSAVNEARQKGIKAGMIRPITLFPFPNKEIAAIANQDSVKSLIVFEMSNGQMLNDVELCVLGKKPIKFYGRMGGVVPKVSEMVEQFETALK